MSEVVFSDGVFSEGVFSEGVFSVCFFQMMTGYDTNKDNKLTLKEWLSGGGF
jgi:hypothetical protein